MAGEDLDPVSTAVVSSFGSWSDKPFAAVVLVAFLACGMAAQGLTARTIYSIARDGVLPGSRVLRRVDRRRSPLPATSLTALIACLGLLLGLSSAAVGSLITFGTAAIYVAFLLIALAALIGAGARPLAARRSRSARARRPGDQRAGRGLARVRDGQHRLAARVARAAGRALVPGLGRAARAGADRRSRGSPTWCWRDPSNAPDPTPAGPSENVEIVRRSLEAFGSGDFDTAFAAHDAEAEWHTAADEPDPQVYRGLAGLDRFVDALGEPWEDRFDGVMKFEDFIERGDWVIVLGAPGFEGAAAGSRSTCGRPTPSRSATPASCGWRSTATSIRR